MNFLTRLFKREKRTKLTSWDLAYLWKNSPVAINQKAAENLATVLACVNAISSGIASLPAYCYRLTKTGRQADLNHPISRFIKFGPNDHQTWPDFIEFILSSVLLRGNALAIIERDPRGQIIALNPVPWDIVSCTILTSGRLSYKISGDLSLSPAISGKTFLEGEVFHLKDRSDDGLTGRSRLQRATAVVQNAISVQTFSGNLYDNGINPSGVIEYPAEMTQDTFERLNNVLKQSHGGAQNAAKVLVLESGMTWKPMSISPEDAELIASRRFSTEELARLFDVPPPIIGDLTHGTFTNTVEVSKWFATRTLAPWARKIETEFQKHVFTGSDAEHELEIDLSGLVRGDYSARWQTYSAAIDKGILTVNEIREQEGWNPLEKSQNAGENVQL